MKNKSYPINQCALFKCNSKKRLEHLLTIEQGDLKLVQSIIKYSNFEIDKKNSTEKRKITAPQKTLKQIQRRILYLLQSIEHPEWLISGTKGKSYIDNGKYHCKSSYVLTMDIEKFYDNCTRENVYSFFKNKMCTSSDVAEILTNIVTFNNGIPTGCPTSQIIAFYAYEEMFSNIKKIADKYGCIFSVYVDDLTFSSDKAFDAEKLKRDVDIELRRYKHKPKNKKIKYYSKYEAKPITGTIVTKEHELATPNSLQHKIYTDFQDIKNDCLSSDEELYKKIQVLEGRIQASKNIEIGANKFPEISRLTNRIKENTPIPTQPTVTRKNTNKKAKIRIKNSTQA